MKACIDEIKEVEQKAKDEGNKPKFSRNQICAKHGISPSSISKRMTGKVKGYGPQLGGARRGKILSQGMFKRHRGVYYSRSTDQRIICSSDIDGLLYSTCSRDIDLSYFL